MEKFVNRLEQARQDAENPLDLNGECRFSGDFEADIRELVKAEVSAKVPKAEQVMRVLLQKYFGNKNLNEVWGEFAKVGVDKMALVHGEFKFYKKTEEFDVRPWSEVESIPVIGMPVEVEGRMRAEVLANSRQQLLELMKQIKS